MNNNVYVNSTLADTLQLIDNVYVVGTVCDLDLENYLNSSLDKEIIIEVIASPKYRRSRVVKLFSTINRQIELYGFSNEYLFASYYESLNKNKVSVFGLDYTEDITVAKVISTIKSKAFIKGFGVKNYYYQSKKRVSSKISNQLIINNYVSIINLINKLLIKYLFFHKLEFYNSVYPQLKIYKHKGFLNNHHQLKLNTLNFKPDIYYDRN